MTGPRLYCIGDVVVDIVLSVPRLPARGADVLAGSSQVAAGGCGLNVLAAAARQGMPVTFCGRLGTGPFGDLARAALLAEGALLLLPPHPGEDSGFTVVLVDGEGERTFATAVGAEARLGPEQLAACVPGPTDAVFVSGYDLCYPEAGPAISGWLPGLPAGATVLADPGPLVAQIPAAVLDAVRARTDWWSCNAAEAQLLTGLVDPGDAARELASGRGRGGAVVRCGDRGAVVAVAGGEPVPVPATSVHAIDSNGAGDAHVGVFLAALSAGLAPVVAVGRANRAAAVVVTRRGSNTAPTAAELG